MQAVMLELAPFQRQADGSGEKDFLNHSSEFLAMHEILIFDEHVGRICDLFW